MLLWSSQIQSNSVTLGRSDSPWEEIIWAQKLQRNWAALFCRGALGRLAHSSFQTPVISTKLLWFGGFCVLPDCEAHAVISIYLHTLGLPSVFSQHSARHSGSLCISKPGPWRKSRPSKYSLRTYDKIWINVRQVLVCINIDGPHKPVTFKDKLLRLRLTYLKCTRTVFLTGNEVQYQKAAISEFWFPSLLKLPYFIYFCQVECFGTMLPTQQ